MKNSFKILVAFFGLALLFSACTPNVNELGPLMAKNALKFSITPSATDSNLIILKSLTPGVTPQWVTPLGLSTRVLDSVKIAFPGTYKFVYGVESAGGFVQADTFTLVIKTTNLNYVSDPKWTLLCGGVGNKKTWVLDIDSLGQTKYWPGSIGYQNDLTVAPWTYFPTYKGNEWLCPAIDYGTMTFNLQGGPNVIINQLGPAAAVLTGTYFLDATAQPFPTVSFSNVIPLNPNYNASEIWSTGHILFLSDNAMEIGFEATKGGEWDVFCYISKAYSDSWVPSK